MEKKTEKLKFDWRQNTTRLKIEPDVELNTVDKTSMVDDRSVHIRIEPSLRRDSDS